MSKLFKKVAIIGVGLIGGSIALDLKKKRLAGTVVGVSRHSESIRIALKRKAVDAGGQDLGIIKDADLVILATPVHTIEELAPRVAKIILKDCIVTDVGSTKQEITSRLEKIFPNFLGAHPLAGMEKRGIRYAARGMFRNSVCILTPTPKTKRQTEEKVRALWTALGAWTISMNASRHDKILSFVSHLPHAIAFSLINSVAKEYFIFAATGLRDTTRIAGSDSGLWADIFLSNRANMLRAIAVVKGELGKFESAIAGRKRKRLLALLGKAQGKRGSLDT